MTMNDPLIDEIRRVRHAISNEVGANLESLIDRYAKLESRFASSPLTQKDRRTKDCTEVADSEVGDGESSPATR